MYVDQMDELSVFVVCFVLLICISDAMFAFVFFFFKQKTAYEIHR